MIFYTLLFHSECYELVHVPHLQPISAWTHHLSRAPGAGAGAHCAGQCTGNAQFSVSGLFLLEPHCCGWIHFSYSALITLDSLSGFPKLFSSFFPHTLPAGLHCLPSAVLTWSTWPALALYNITHRCTGWFGSLNAPSSR